MKDINNSDMEKMLLTGKTIDELIQMKMEEEYKALLAKPKPKIGKVEDISKLSPSSVFSKESVFKVFNKVNGMESYINGIQAEAMLGMQETAREALLNGRTKAFVTDNSYVEFLYAKTVV